jgi:hypothetical protein
MNNAISPGLPLIYTSAWQTQQPLSGSNPTVISQVFSLSAAESAVVQIFTDGGCSVDYIFQVTTLPLNINRFGFTINGAISRDDSVGSPHWDVTSTGTIDGSTPAKRIQTLLLSTSLFRHGRVIFKYNSGGSGKLVAILGTTE